MIGGAGETFLPITELLTAALRTPALPAELLRCATAWLDSYAGRDDESQRRELVTALGDSVRRQIESLSDCRND